MNQVPVVTLSFFRFNTFSQKYRAFTMMRKGHQYLKNEEGLKFYRLMGSGRGNGFHWRADFSTYALLTVWESEELATRFLLDSKIHEIYQKHSVERFSVFMKPLKSHGAWAGENPFVPVEDPVDGPVAILTRATIKYKYLHTFWSMVPSASKSIPGRKGLIFAKGIGEWPLRYMATFSIWENETVMKTFAYENPEHLKVIQKTRQLNWYKEELFARFRPYKSIGTWNGEALF